MPQLFSSRPVLLSTLLILFSGFLFQSCTPMCPIPSCEVRMVHRHGKGEFRGSKWYKKQNPRIGEKLPKPTKDGVEPHNDNSQMRK
ncbi:hypothetical protein [Adhaeribacter soli]|uniref:Uncharacterized protein n=1 Tax=Adhaeribacter soli TaxID=2607655 RepID=A0A5N1J7T8_9BACT|nr:hypothetical protein [Adhaeribacter soli]KAA9346173.1 hypothetical protein F0P94_03575 [Adhaeribacter soli]